MYNQFLPIYNSLITNNTPYSLEISGSVESSNVSYNVLVALDVDFPSSNNTVHVFVTEDNIDSYWSGAATNHDARNVARAHYKSDSDMGKKLGEAMYNHIKNG